MAPGEGKFYRTYSGHNGGLVLIGFGSWAMLNGLLRALGLGKSDVARIHTSCMVVHFFSSRSKH